MHEAYDPKRRVKDKVYYVDGMEIRNGRRWYGESFERKAKWEHYAKFEEMAQRLGVEALKSLVPFKKDVIEKSLQYEKEHDEEGMNTFLPLQRWDNQDPLVRNLSRAAGDKGWCLSY